MNEQNNEDYNAPNESSEDAELFPPPDPSYEAEICRLKYRMDKDSGTHRDSGRTIQHPQTLAV